MTRRSESPEEIERILALEFEYRKKGVRNDDLPHLHQLTSDDFKVALQAATTDALVAAAYDHYAAARILFQLGLTWYAMFCGQQMVEVYLKAFLKSRLQSIPTTHSLKDLLDRCRQADPACQFVGSVYIETIVLRFDPYNEVGRYPVAKRKPKRGFSCKLPYTMWELDYFALRMSECVPLSEKRSDPLKSPASIGRTALKSSLFKILFRRYNMNVTDESLTLQAEQQPLHRLLTW